LLHVRDGSLLGLHEFRVDFAESRGHRWRWLVESCGDLALLLVDGLETLVLLVFGDGLEVLWRSVKQGDTDMSLLERTDVVGAITSHEGGVTEVPQRGKDKLFLHRGDSRIHPGILHELYPAGTVFVLFEGGTSDANVVIAEDGRVERVVGIDGDDLCLVNRTPDEV
jgi:hypothetical protein